MFFRKKAKRSNAKSARTSRAGPSIIGADVVIQGNIVTGGELQIDGTVQGDVRASAIVVGPQGTVQGELAGEDIFLRGRVIGPIRGLRVQVFAGAHVDGDIIHDSLAVETGAFCQGTIRRSDEPLAEFAPQQPQPALHHPDGEGADDEDQDMRRPPRRPIMLRSRAAE